jgi:hypothetical protein
VLHSGDSELQTGGYIKISTGIGTKSSSGELRLQTSNAGTAGINWYLLNLSYFKSTKNVLRHQWNNHNRNRYYF